MSADVFVYPGSGATTDTQLLKAQRAAQQAALAGPAAAAGDAGVHEQTFLNGPVPAAGVKTEDGAAHSSGLVSTLMLASEPVVSCLPHTLQRCAGITMSLSAYESRTSFVHAS